ncbi:histidine phosphatase family protein [Paenibacillus sp. IITD108]|uniref:histidine phosphatase family protein n=1 Tax=Paenibacillus sp. IITD108 TaxID=3116649 RepID=UPI002F42AF46
MNEKTTVYIVRHGQTEWNIEHRLQGHQDSPLTELGVNQAKWLGDSLENAVIDVIYSSSSQRTMKTADLIRNHRDIPIYKSDELKEINLGIWEGRKQEEVKLSHPQQFDYFWNDPELFRVERSETFLQVANRAVHKLNEIIAQHTGKHILIVTHTVVVKVLMAFFEDRPMKQLWELPYIHPTCLSKIVIEEDKAEIVLHGDISHFKE